MSENIKINWIIPKYSSSRRKVIITGEGSQVKTNSGSYKLESIAKDAMVSMILGFFQAPGKSKVNLRTIIQEKVLGNNQNVDIKESAK